MRRIVSTCLCGFLSVAAEAALLGRAPVEDASDPPTTDQYQAWYDTRLGITWLDDTSYAQTSGYDDDGRMTWVDAQAWIASLNAANHLGISNWRLPHALPVHEMHDLNVDTLGNFSVMDPPYTCSGCFINGGPFDNWQTGDYWTDTLEPGGQWATDYHFVTGFIGNGQIHESLKHAWAVSDGDLAVVPVPAALGLLVTALGWLASLRGVRWPR